MDVPDWALRMVEEVCLENNREVPEVKWRMKRGNGFGTRGTYKRYKNGVIMVSVGKDHLEKQVLLHELSHHLDREGGHGGTFFIILRDLLLKHDCLTPEYKARENEYRKLSKKFF